MRDEQGHVEEITVQKGILFKKEIDIPADRIQVVDGHDAQGTVKVDVDKREIQGLKSVGREELVGEQDYSIATATDAAQALRPVLGPFATYLFAIGLIGAGVVAIPILLASTSYAVAGTFGWPSGLSKKPWQSEGFYLILTLALLASLAAALLRLNPIALLFWANVLSGILAPLLVFLLLLIANNKKIMGRQRLGLLTNTFLVLTLVVEVVTTVLLFYSLATGQGW